MIDGILLGALFAGVALGLSLVFGIANILNLAHGAFLVFGAYCVFALQQTLGMHAFVALPIAAAAAYFLGWCTYRWFGLARIMSGSVLMVIVFTFGLDLIIVHGIGYAYGAESRSITMPSFINDAWYLGDIIIPTNRFYAALGSILLVVGVDLAIKRSRFGRSIRATRLDRDMAAMNGVNTDSVYAHTMGIGAAAAAAAGFFVAMGAPINPEMNVHYLVIAFAVAIIAGFGRIDFVILGGLAYGTVLSLAQVWLGGGIGTALAFALLFILLLIRPQGLFGSSFY